MDNRTLGRTDLTVSRLGLGLAQIGALTVVDEKQVGDLINRALDAGITFLDTAASYRNSEELIGRTLGSRRREYVLATKCGHWAGEDPWTAETVRAHVDRSLQRLQTDCVDLLQIHSCGVDVLERGDVIQAALEARDAGKARYVGYSGDNEAAEWAVDSGLFDTLQTTFNLVDQGARERLFPKARDQHMGLIVKRTIANGALVGTTEKAHTTVQFMNIHERVQELMALGPIPGAPEDPILLALGFTLAHPEIDVALVGSTRSDHVADNVRRFEEQLPIPDGVVGELHERFGKVGADWAQLT